jgi:hypothetical protein
MSVDYSCKILAIAVTTTIASQWGYISTPAAKASTIEALVTAAARVVLATIALVLVEKPAKVVLPIATVALIIGAARVALILGD